MKKKKFFSLKYQRYILPEEARFWEIARAEAEHRLADNIKMNCPCLHHVEEKDKLEKFLQRLNVKK
jgi:hypothetical protein